MDRNVLYIGNTNPSLSAILTYADGSVVDGTGHANPQFALRRAYASTNTFKAAGVWVNRPAGSVRYDFGATDLTGLVPDIYNGQWIDTDGSGKLMTMQAGEFEVRKAF